MGHFRVSSDSRHLLLHGTSTHFACDDGTSVYSASQRSSHSQEANSTTLVSYDIKTFSYHSSITPTSEYQLLSSFCLDDIEHAGSYAGIAPYVQLRVVSPEGMRETWQNESSLSSVATLCYQQCCNQLSSLSHLAAVWILGQATLLSSLVRTINPPP